jgi:putative protease
MSATQIELLAPAKDYHTGVVAIDYGADAVYIGGPGFGARRSASNNIDEIRRLADYAHLYGVRVYATLNTVVFEDELKEAEAIARALTKAGADALIIQDMAYLRMGLTGVEFHASTQMCNMSPENIKFLEHSGISRVVLERELTLEDIKNIRSRTNIELESFIHGAICVGFSGHCYLSRSMSPRSGNRGDCSQSCRLKYDLTDDNDNVLYKSKHLLSVQDMNMSGNIGRLLDAGVTSFKIEGRLKDESYVRNTVAYYRRELDKEIAARDDMRRASSGHTISNFAPDLAKSFSRGGTTWMLDGGRHGVSSFDTPKATGEYLGKVTRTGRNYFEISGKTALHNGDGICYFHEGELLGTNINRTEGGRIYPNAIGKIATGTAIYRNYDHAFESAASSMAVRRAIDATADITVSDTSIELRLTDEDGCQAIARFENNFDPAQKPDKMLDTIRTQTEKSGDSIYDIHVAAINCNIEVPFIPISSLNELRRNAIEQLTQVRTTKLPHHLKPAVEERDYPYPAKQLDGTANVTNSLAEQFYRDHGVTDIAPQLELQERLSGECVMETAYCIRREIGECLKEAPKYRGALYLSRGTIDYLLDFDCARCRMKLIKTRKEQQP